MSETGTGTRLWREFDAICDCGGRLCGTESERAAVALLARLGQEATGAAARVESVAYDGWRATGASLTGPDGAAHPLHVLLRSAPTPPRGIEAEVLDLGRGTGEEFMVHAAEIPGRIVMVRHELMFAPGTIHRRFKISRAIESGAVAFLIAGPEEGAPVAGSARAPGHPAIPAAGIAPATARAFARTAAGRPRARLSIATEQSPASADNLIFDIPGPEGAAQDDMVVLSAHVDGHALGESAIDNASGLAVALEAVRRVLPRRAGWRRGLRLAFFNIEEWALTGSAAHVAALDEAARARVALNLNLDSVAGGERLTALTSGFAGLEPFLLRAAEGAGTALGLFRPLQMNSDHGNFARAGIPALRLVAGFGEAAAPARLVLTPLDRRGIVSPAELDRAARMTEALLAASLAAPASERARWRSRG